MARSDLDWIIIDMDHGPIDIGKVQFHEGPSRVRYQSSAHDRIVDNHTMRF